MITEKPFEIAIKEFCSQDDSRPERGGIHNDGSYLVATDGHTLVEIDLSVYGHLYYIGESRTGYPDWKSVLNNSPSPQPINNSINALRVPPSKIPDDDVAPVPEKVCPECEGVGMEDHDCDCEFCDTPETICSGCGGDGKVQEGDVKTYCVKVDKTFYRALYINRIVELFEAFGVTDVSIYQPNPPNALRVESDGVICLCMPFLIYGNSVDGVNGYEVVHEIKLTNNA